MNKTLAWINEEIYQLRGNIENRKLMAKIDQEKLEELLAIRQELEEAVK